MCRSNELGMIVLPTRVELIALDLMASHIAMRFHLRIVDAI